VEVKFVAQPLVSILINNYNYGHYLAAAIDSALTQSYAAIEVIVVDDGSTDDSRQIIQGYGDRIRAVFQANQGQAAAFNTGFVHSRGEIICFLDADDLFLPDKVAQVVAGFLQYPVAGWCLHPQHFWRSAQAPTLAAKVAPAIYRDVMAMMRRGKLGDPFDFPIPATSSMCFSRSLLQQILPMPVGEGISLNDSYVKFVALGMSPGVTINQELTLQRIHGENAFTFKVDRRQVAKIHVLMAYWMQKNFPQLTKFTNNLLAVGMAAYQQAGGVEPNSQRLSQEYLQGLGWRHRVQYQSKLWFYALKA
jgi:glycosyltransferase involved in cell wall biosynthesis